MKINLLKSVVFIALIVFVGYNINKSKVDTKQLSRIVQINVEALADNESGPGKTYCCGNSATCALILGGGEIVGIPFVTPCPD